MSARACLVSLPFALLLLARPPPTAGAEAGPAAGHEMLNSVLWQQTAGEYIAAARQVYTTARARLDEALSDPGWTAALEQTGDFRRLPPAVLLDLDETVLNNGGYEARIVLRYGEFTPATFAAWCREGGGDAVPGAREFLRHAERRGVAVVYFSARRDALRQCTADRLRRLDLPLSDPVDALRMRDGRNKSGHRSEIARRYRILLIVGDNLEDFLPSAAASPERRRALAAAHGDRWGTRWLIVPNAMYGHWEAAHYGYDWRMDRAAKLERKRRALRP